MLSRRARRARLRSLIALTPHGRRAFRGHVRALNAIIAHIADPGSALADDTLSAQPRARQHEHQA